MTGLIEVSWAFGLLIGVTTMGLVTAATSWRVGYLSGAIAVAIMAVIVIPRGRRVHDARAEPTPCPV